MLRTGPLTAERSVPVLKLLYHRASVALLAVVLPGLTLAACNRITSPGGRTPESLATLSLALDVTVEDSMRLACGPGTPVDSAHHWVSGQSLVRLASNGTAELAILVEDLPPSRIGGFRCGGEGHSEGVERPGTYTARNDGVVDFRWGHVSSPDTAGVWVTSEDAWISDGIPISDRHLSAVLEFKGRSAPVVLGFPITGGP